MTDDWHLIGNERSKIMRVLAANGFEDEEVQVEFIDDMTEEEVDTINQNSIYTWPGIEIVQVPESPRPRFGH